MAEITLTAAMRSNLLSLQGTQTLLDQTQLRLSTGKKVNSALDNPINFFAAQTLNNRASDLSALLDGMGQSIQALKTTNQAITTLTSYVNQLKSIANSAKGALSSSTSAYAHTGTVSLSAAQVNDLTFDVHSLTGSTTVAAGDDLVADLGLTDGTEITFTHGTDVATYTVDTASGDTVQDFIDNINAQDKGFSLSIVGSNLVVTSDDATDVTIEDNNSNADIALLGLDDGSGGNGTTAALGNPLVTADDSFKITVGTTDYTVTVTAGMSADDLIDAVSTATTGKVTASLVADPDNAANKLLKFTGANASDSFTIANDTGTAGTDLGINGAAEVSSDLTQVQAYQTSYANVIAQITQTAKDASYQGSNLVDGTSGSMVIQVNERSSQPITIANKDLTASGDQLNLDDTVTWTSVSDIDATITKISSALSNLRAVAGSFANDLSLIQTRQDFTTNLVNTLKDGATQLTIADTNEEGANLLSLQTSQQLGIQALSLSAQANQSVLRLFS